MSLTTSETTGVSMIACTLLFQIYHTRILKKHTNNRSVNDTV